MASQLFDECREAADLYGLACVIRREMEPKASEWSALSDTQKIPWLKAAKMAMLAARAPVILCAQCDRYFEQNEHMYWSKDDLAWECQDCHYKETVPS